MQMQWFFVGRPRALLLPQKRPRTAPPYVNDDGSGTAPFAFLESELGTRLPGQYLSFVSRRLSR